MNYYKATFSNGKVTSRSSARSYTHAWIGGYCSSEKLAQKAAGCCHGDHNKEVVPVEEISEKEYRYLKDNAVAERRGLA